VLRAAAGAEMNEDEEDPSETRSPEAADATGGRLFGP